MKPFILLKNTYRWFISEYEKGTLQLVFDETKETGYMNIVHQ